jgi:PKD repeat protein
VQSWRLDFGDGTAKAGGGTPPKTLLHTYAKEGDFRPTMRAVYDAKTIYTGATSVMVHADPLISLTVQPPAGKTPLAVTYTLQTSITKPVKWVLDYGDGTRAAGAGDPPKSLKHTYAKAGNYKATFSVQPTGLSLVATFAAVTAGGGTPPVLALKATAAKSKVTFDVTSNVPPTVVSWEIQFGDGQTQTGQGLPPTRLTHTYAKKGTYTATLFVAQQQAYGGVRYRTSATVTAK